MWNFTVYHNFFFESNAFIQVLHLYGVLLSIALFLSKIYMFLIRKEFPVWKPESKTSHLLLFMFWRASSSLCTSLKVLLWLSSWVWFLQGSPPGNSERLSPGSFSDLIWVCPSKVFLSLHVIVQNFPNEFMQKHLETKI